MFVVGRLILGMGIPFAIVAASSLIGGSFFIATSSTSYLTRCLLMMIELSHPKERGRLGSLFNSCYFIGIFYSMPYVLAV
jgi:hypothetical protein